MAYTWRKLLRKIDQPLSRAARCTWLRVIRSPCFFRYVHNRSAPHQGNCTQLSMMRCCISRVSTSPVC